MDRHNKLIKLFILSPTQSASIYLEAPAKVTGIFQLLKSFDRPPHLFELGFFDLMWIGK